MGALSNLISGERREEYRDFADRYDKGAPPYDDISDEETLDRYREVAAELSEEDYQAAAREAFSKMSSEERMEFGRQLRDQSIQLDLDFPGESAEDRDERFEDPDLLARITARANREHSDLLENLLKGGGHGLVGGALGDGVHGGEGASGGEGGMTSNPPAKSAMVGIVATAVKQATENG